MPKPIISCQLTGSVGPAINAHVIPRSLYEFNGDGQLIYLGEDSYRNKRALEYGIEKSKVDSVRSKLFVVLMATYQERDRLRLLVQFRKAFISVKVARP